MQVVAKEHTQSFFYDLSRVGLKTGLLVLGLFIIGLPMKHVDQALLFFLFFLAVVSIQRFSFHFTPKKLFIWLSVFLFLFVCWWLIPIPQIQEGHNLYLYPLGKNSSAYSELPLSVSQIFKQEFLKNYPRTKWCANQPGVPCWRVPVRPDATYAFSSDSFWQHPLYSRVTENIDFDSLSELAPGFVNAIYTNWYPKISDVKRTTMPYFVMYQLPQAALQSQLCWQGKLLWEQTPNHFLLLNAKNETCRTIAPEDIGKQVYGFRIDPASTLSMKIKWTYSVVAWKFLKLLVSVSLLACLLQWGKLSWRHMGWSLFWFALASICFRRHGLWDYPIYSAGNDGLTYYGWGQLIVYYLKHMQIGHALMGSEPVFWYTPGMRYVQGALQVLYGDSSFLGMVFIAFGFFILLGRLLQKLFSFRVALFLFLFPVIMDRLFHFNTISDMVLGSFTRGYAEFVADTLLLGGVFLLITNFLKNKRLSSAWLAMSAFAFAVIIRPNYAIGIAFASFYCLLPFILKREFGKLILVGSGLIFSLLPLVHNLIFGHQFVIFSTNINSYTYEVPVSIYLKAFVNLFTSHHNNTSQIIIAHWNEWFNHHIALGVFSLLTLVLLGCLSKNTPLRLIAWTALGLQVPCLFWSCTYRYAAMAWFMTQLAFYIFLSAYLIEKFKGFRFGSFFRRSLQDTYQ